MFESLLIKHDSITFLIYSRSSFFTLHSSDSTTPWLQDNSHAQIFEERRKEKKEKINFWRREEECIELTFTSTKTLPIYNEITCTSSSSQNNSLQLITTCI